MDVNNKQGLLCHQLLYGSKKLVDIQSESNASSLTRPV